MSSIMDIYMKLHEARCQQIKGNSSSSLLLYMTVLQMIEEAKAVSEPKEMESLNTLTKLVNEEYALVQRTSQSQPAQPAQQQSLFPQLSASFSQPAQQSLQSSVTSTTSSVSSVYPEKYPIAVEMLDDDQSTHPPFRDQLMHDWEYVKKLTSKSIDCCVAGYETCVDGCKKVASNPRVTAFASTSKEAGKAFVNGFVDSFVLFFKAFQALFTDKTEEEKQEIVQAAEEQAPINKESSENTSESSSTSVFPSLRQEGNMTKGITV